MILQTAERKELTAALTRAKAFIMLEQLAPAIQSFEIETRNAYRKQIVEQIEEAIALVGPAVCAKCGCETKGEVAWVHGEEWCHPCADQADIPGVVGKARE